MWAFIFFFFAAVKIVYFELVQKFFLGGILFFSSSFFVGGPKKMCVEKKLHLIPHNHGRTWRLDDWIVRFSENDIFITVKPSCYDRFDLFWHALTKFDNSFKIFWCSMRYSHRSCSLAGTVDRLNIRYLALLDNLTLCQAPTLYCLSLGCTVCLRQYCIPLVQEQRKDY